MSAGAVCHSLHSLGLALAVSSPLAGQAVLTGLVTEAGTGRPLSGVEVFVQGTGRTITSDKAGEYALKTWVQPGLHVLQFRSVGFRPVQMAILLEKGSVKRLDAILVPLAVRIDPLVVAAEAKRPRGMDREAFEERRHLGFGQFIDSLELRRSEDRRLSDLLRGRGGIVMAQSRFATSSRTGCYMQIIYDGHSVYSPSAYAPPMPSARGSRSARSVPPPSPFDINTFAVSGLEGVEVYRSLADTPLQFGGASAGCGTVVLWSRRGGLPPKQ